MRIKITTPCRLHFTLIDENGEIGRIDGGIGLSIKEPNFEIEMFDSTSIQKKFGIKKEFHNIDKIQKVLDTQIGKVIIKLELTDCSNPEKLLMVLADIVETFIKNYLNNHNHISKEKFPLLINVTDHLSSHIGFGSKTQMCLAIAKGFALVLEKNLSIEELTELVERGGTSGIGFRAFESGGFIFDAGHRYGENEEKSTFLPSSASSAKPARTLLRYDFPENWVVLVVTLNVKAGASNTEEVNIFQEYCPIQIEEVRELSHIIIMKTLPGILEKNLRLFGNAIEQIQKIGFKKIEVSLQDAVVRDLMKFQEDEGALGVGMSSFGPTIYSFFNTEEKAKQMIEKISKKYSDIGFEYYITSADNNGATIKIIEE